MKILLLLFAMVPVINYCFGKNNTFPLNGFVGIETTSPSDPLTVMGRIQTRQALYVSGYNLSFSHQGGYLVWNYSKNIDCCQGERNFVNNQELGGLGRFRWYNTPDSGTRANLLMTLTKKGSLGAGTASPQEKIHVVGNVRVDGSYLIRSQNGNEAGLISASGETDTYNSIQIASNRGEGSIIFCTNPSGSTTKVSRFTNSGNLGIGTTTPQSKLPVNGTISAKQVKVMQGGGRITYLIRLL